jgi:hypothetical protein
LFIGGEPRPASALCCIRLINSHNKPENVTEPQTRSILLTVRAR